MEKDEVPSEGDGMWTRGTRGQMVTSFLPLPRLQGLFVASYNTTVDTFLIQIARILR
jgi:hypothetical protein